MSVADRSDTIYVELKIHKTSRESKYFSEKGIQNFWSRPMTRPHFLITTRNSIKSLSAMPVSKPMPVLHWSKYTKSIVRSYGFSLKIMFSKPREIIIAVLSPRKL